VALAQIEPIIVFVRVVFVPQKSKRSNAAKLLAGALLTPEGQTILEDGWSASSLFRPGTPAAKFVAGKKLALPSVDFEKEKSLALQKEFEKVLVRR
jgi:ABC-type Fe3+ transport system substrate-binding protein